MPAAEAGRKIRFFWSVEQATGHRDIGRAGSDTFAGNLNYTIELNTKKINTFGYICFALKSKKILFFSNLIFKK